MKEAGFIEIFVNNQAQTPVYYDNMMVSHSGGNVAEVNAYYPFGAIIPDLSNPAWPDQKNLYKYNAKELQEEMGLQWLDYGARMMDPVVGRWWTPDPLAEKYYSTSPYAFCLNNPILYVDPDGREVFISGALSEEALRQLQERVKNKITLSMGEGGKLGYTMNEGVKKLKGEAKMLAGIIDDTSISVNLITTDKHEASPGMLMVGGAFMGNTVTTDAEGNVMVSANQVVNPQVLGAMSKTNLNPGMDMMHETTEAYEGAKISQERGISSPASNQEGSVYWQAHNRATPQSGRVYETVYAPNGRVVNSIHDKNATRVIYSTSPYLAPYGVQRPKGLVNIQNTRLR